MVVHGPSGSSIDIESAFAFEKKELKDVSEILDEGGIAATVLVNLLKKQEASKREVCRQNEVEMNIGDFPKTMFADMLLSVMFLIRDDTIFNPHRSIPADCDVRRIPAEHSV
jgi:hypothetical protein